MLCFSEQLTSLNLFQDLSLYWATVPSHFSLLLAETTVSLLSKRATTGSRKKNIFWKETQKRERGERGETGVRKEWENTWGAKDAAKCRWSEMEHFREHTTLTLWRIMGQNVTMKQQTDPHWKTARGAEWSFHQTAEAPSNRIINTGELLPRQMGHSIKLARELPIR